MKSLLKTCVLVGACVAVAGLCAPASAGIKYWDPITNGGGTSDWMNPNNWNEGGVGPGVPGAADHVIIHSFSPTPILSAAAPTINYFTPGWHGVDTHTGFNPGSSLHVNQSVILGGTATGASQVSIMGGTLSTSAAYYSGWNPLVTDVNGDGSHSGKGFTHVNAGGTLDVANVGFWGGSTADPQWHTGDNANIDIELGGTVKIGRQLGAGELDWWNSIGVVTALDGTGVVNESYDSGTGITTLTASDPFTPLWTADFEDGEINSSYHSGVLGNGLNTEAYPSIQPADLADSTWNDPANPGDGYGWTNRPSGWTDGGTTIVDTESYSGENSAAVENRTLRSDIPLVLDEGIYRFKYWFMVPEGQDLEMVGKYVIKDQTNGYMFSTTTDLITAPANDVWFSRTITFNPGEDAAYIAHLAGLGKTLGDETIQLRFGNWFQDDQGDVVYTDDWSLGYMVPEPASLLLMGLGGLALLRRR